MKERSEKDQKGRGKEVKRRRRRREEKRRRKEEEKGRKE